jgi:hypothetical protein
MTAPRPAYAPPVLMTAQRGGESASTSAKMSFYDLQNLFWQLDASERFSGTETRLFFYWLNRLNAGLNGEFWPDEYPRWGKQVEADLGLTDKTLAAARTVLVKRGLLSYREGTKSRAAAWGLGKISRSNSGQSDEIAPNMARNNSGQSGTIPPNMSRNNSGLYKEKTKTLTTTEDKDPAADAAGADSEKKEALTFPAERPADASHTEGGAADAAKPKPVGPRGWAYDPAAIANNLRLPFASAEFRTAWVGYRTYREEQKHRRLTGGMMEQQQLDKLAQLSASDEATALALIAQTIAKGWQDFYPLDKPRPTTSHASASTTSKPGTARHHVPTVSSYGKL